MSSSESSFANSSGAMAVEATDWETLARRLAEDVRDLRGANPLKPITLVVPSVGMKVWLTRKMADLLGVSANVDAVTPLASVTRYLEPSYFGLIDEGVDGRCSPPGARKIGSMMPSAPPMIPTAGAIRWGVALIRFQLYNNESILIH